MSAPVFFRAPKGRNTKAQGNALGERRTRKAEALKGRDRGPMGHLSRPFRALAFLPTRFPRALPWAFLLRPSGARPRERRGPAVARAIGESS